MKQTVIFTLVVVLVCSVLFAVTGCGESVGTSSSNPTATATDTPFPKSYDDDEVDWSSAKIVYPQQTTLLPDEMPFDTSIAVVYYSATGTTADIAEKIADLTHGTLFALEPFELYTEEDLDYNDPQSRVSIEHEEGTDVLLVENNIPNWESVEYVYLGYPIWFGEAAFPMQSFVESVSFEGKIVIPFCTSSESGIGQSGTQLAEQAGTGTWLKGIRFASDATSAEIKNSLSEYGIGVDEDEDAGATASASPLASEEAEVTAFATSSGEDEEALIFDIEEGEVSPSFEVSEPEE